MRLFVGNLSFETTDAEVRDLFSTVGTCKSATIMTDRATGRSRGFGFVEMGSDTEAQRAISELNGRELGGRTINVSEARERSERGGPPRPGPSHGYTPDAKPFGSRFPKDGGSRRGLRGRKRSL